MADPYLQGDGKTLKNKLGITNDPETLAAKEAVHVNSRLMELYVNGLPQAEGFELVKGIHRYLFQDVYDWAGQPRETNLARAIYADGRDDLVRFTPPARIEAEGRQLFDDFTAANQLRGLTPEQFANSLSPFFARLNQLHPFREGNGRTQRIIWEHFAKRAGHELSFEGISRERMVIVSIAASAGEYMPAQRMFTELLNPVRSEALRTATRFLEANRTDVNWQDRYVATTEPGRSYGGTFVGTGGPNFLMHDGKSIYIGNLTDLPNEGRDLQGGDRVTFRAGPATIRAAQQEQRAGEIQPEEDKQREREQRDEKRVRDRGKTRGPQR